MNILGAGGAVFCPAGAGEDARAADFAAAQLLGAEDGLFQLWLLGQHGAAEPPADQAAGDKLRANTVQQQAVAIQEVTAALCKAAHAAELPRRQARASRPAAARWGQACTSSPSFAMSFAKSFHLTSCPIYQSIHFCVD